MRMATQDAFMVCVDEKVSAFVELERPIHTFAVSLMVMMLNQLSQLSEAVKNIIGDSNTAIASMARNAK